MLFSPTRMSVARQMLRLSAPFVTVAESVTPSYRETFKSRTVQMPPSVVISTEVRPLLSGAQLADHSQPSPLTLGTKRNTNAIPSMSSVRPLMVIVSGRGAGVVISLLGALLFWSERYPDSMVSTPQISTSMPTT